MGLIAISLVAGVAVGYTWRNSPGNVKKASMATLIGLFFLLTIMGAQLGSNREVLSELGEMGIQALVIAAMCIAGSVVPVQLASGYIQKNLHKSEKKISHEAGEKL